MTNRWDLSVFSRGTKVQTTGIIETIYICLCVCGLTWSNRSLWDSEIFRFHLHRYTCSGCTVCIYCTHKMGPTQLMHSLVACDTSRWNAKQPQSSLSAGRQIFYTSFPAKVGFTFSRTDTHRCAAFTFFFILQGKIKFALPFVDSYCIF